MSGDSLLKVPEVAAFFGVSVSTIYNWVELYDPPLVPVVRLGPRAIRFRREDLEQVVAERTVAARVENETKAQGLDSHVEDPTVVATVAGLLGPISEDGEGGDRDAA